MKKNFLKNNFVHLIREIYIKLFLINDTPHKIALGLGLGVFVGIMPGTGLIAALFLAFICRANRAAALLGSILTNTWLSVVTFLLSIKVGSAIMKLDWRNVYADCTVFIKHFQWFDLFKASILKLVLPLIVGYAVISAGLGLAAYLLTLIIIKVIKKCA
jgi:hypothetical protein